MPGFDLNNLPATEAEIDFSDIEAQYQIPVEEGFDSIVVVDNLPIVDPSKEEKLVSYLRSRAFKGLEIKDGGVFMPKEVDEKGELKSKGYCFIEFKSPEDASEACKKANGYRLDKSHTLAVNRFVDVEKYSNMEDEFQEPEAEEYVEKEHLRSWLMDPKARDQWVLYRGDEVSIFWNQKTEAPEHVHSRTNWTETYVQWSPLGTYLATFHRQGIALWGGPSWNKIVRFFHPGVRLINFSPGERYLVTWSPEPIHLEYLPADQRQFGPEDEGNQIFVWDIVTGALLRSFPAHPQKQDKQEKPTVQWPIFKWSPSERYFARVTPGQQISVYEAPGMGLLDKKSIKVEGVVDFEWAPVEEDNNDKNKEKEAKKQKEEVLAYWTPEIGNQPARVTLINIPSRQILRTKNLFNVNNCKLHWQSQGAYLCVKVDRHTKTKKSTFTNLEIFHMRERDIPVEVVEVPDTVIAFSWEPTSNRFALITTNDPNAGQPSVTTLRTAAHIYHLEAPKGSLSNAEFKLLKTMDKKSCNALFFSPKGRHLVLATLRSTTVWDLEFWDLDFEGVGEKKDAKKEDPAMGVQQMNKVEHFGVTEVEWDPTGRYVAAGASVWRHTMENGYGVYDFRGQLLYKQHIDKFKQLLWRPRPKTLLTKEQIKQIRKKLRDYSKQFDEEDALASRTVSDEQRAHRRRLLNEWYAWRKRVEKDVAEERVATGKPAPAKRAEQEHVETIEEYVEEVVEETEEIVDE
ncbi:uncharacterized protein VTP21DRAFT_10846 [Calcarisporiella thermophila]|uniref:uncharacterized protein n=1 Tax=Calcarisporiella thermophila TaxID=911321 RepID=UPI003744AA89